MFHVCPDEPESIRPEFFTTPWSGELRGERDRILREWAS